MEERDRDLAERLQKQEHDLQDKLKKVDEAQEALKVNLHQLLKEKTQEYEKRQKSLQEDLLKATQQVATYETELKQIMDTRHKDEKLYHEMQEELADEKEKLDARDSKIAKELEEMVKALKDQYREERNNQQRQDELNAELSKKKKRKRYFSACLPPIMGIGMIVLGVVTGNPAFLLPGGSMMVGGGGDMLGGSWLPRWLSSVLLLLDNRSLFGSFSTIVDSV